jgi:EpsI family protein
MTKLAVALAFVALNFYVYQFLASSEMIPPRESFEAFPLEVGDWRCPGFDEMDAKSLRVLGASDYLLCNYHNEQTQENVAVYVGYHESQVRRGGGGGETVIHPPEHCLPGAGWDIIDSRREPISFAGLPPGTGLRDSGPVAKRFVIARGDERQLVYFWYQGQGRVITANEDVILFRFWDRATKGRTDAALIRFTTPIHRGDVAAAEDRFERFAGVLVPLLPPHVPQ